MRHAHFGSLDFLLGLEPHLAFNFLASLLLRNKSRAGMGFFFCLSLGRFPSQGRLAFLLPQFFLKLAATLLGFLRLALSLFARLLLNLSPFLMLRFEAGTILLLLAQPLLSFNTHGLGFFFAQDQFLFEIAQTLFGHPDLQLGFLAGCVLSLLLCLQLSLSLGAAQRLFLRAVFCLFPCLAGGGFPTDQFGFQFLQFFSRPAGLGLEFFFSLAGGLIAVLQLLFNQCPIFFFFPDARFKIFTSLASILFARQQLFFKIAQAGSRQLGSFFHFLAR